MAARPHVNWVLRRPCCMKYTMTIKQKSRIIADLEEVSIPSTGKDVRHLQVTRSSIRTDRELVSWGAYAQIPHLDWHYCPSASPHSSHISHLTLADPHTSQHSNVDLQDTFIVRARDPQICLNDLLFPPWDRHTLPFLLHQTYPSFAAWPRTRTRQYRTQERTQRDLSSWTQDTAQKELSRATMNASLQIVSLLKWWGTIWYVVFSDRKRILSLSSWSHPLYQHSSCFESWQMMLAVIKKAHSSTASLSQDRVDSTCPHNNSTGGADSSNILHHSWHNQRRSRSLVEANIVTAIDPADLDISYNSTCGTHGSVLTRQEYQVGKQPCCRQCNNHHHNKSGCFYHMDCCCYFV